MMRETCEPGVMASTTSASSARNGLLLGAAAVVFWSFGSSVVFLGAQKTGTWNFVALSSLTGGALQLAARRRYQGELRTALRLPWRLWLVPVSCFVLYGLAWPWALASSSPRQVFGVSLINYLWPILTVLLSAWWVPGVHLNGRTLLAMLLALTGLLCANLEHIREWLSARRTPDTSPVRWLLPYVLAFIAALTWAVYSAVLVRWRGWARAYVTSPIGFILTGVCALVVAAFGTGQAVRPTRLGLTLTILYAVGPLAGGYLVWELALPRARVQALSLIAAATPVLSTFLLCLFLATMPRPELILAACLVSAGVVLSMGE